MDPASLLIAGISALGGGASAIVAWAARADSLVAARRAEAAEEAALRAWQDSAAALIRANDLQERQFAERLARERKLRRVEVAEHVRRWYSESAMRTVIGVRATPEQNAEKRDLAIRLSSTDEPGAHALGLEVIEATKKAEKGNLRSAMNAAAAIGQLTFSWIEDPEQFMADRKATITVESLVDRMQGSVDDMEAALKLAADHEKESGGENGVREQTNAND